MMSKSMKDNVYGLKNGVYETQNDVYDVFAHKFINFRKICFLMSMMSRKRSSDMGKDIT
jgi:hypothetical protein